jgi:hypothetical protein
MTAYYATITNSAGTVIVLNDESHYRFAPEGLPTGIYNLPFSVVAVAVPANDPVEAYQTHLYEVREIKMLVQIRGESPTEVATLAAELIEDLTYDVWAKTRSTFIYTADNGITRAIRCALTAVGDLQDWINRYPMGAGSLHCAASIPITLRCQSPCWYDPVEDTFDTAFDGATPVELACPNGGNEDAYPRITYTGAVTNPKVTDWYGHVFELTLDVAAGGEVYIDFDPLNFTCTHTPSGGAATDVRNLQTLASREILVNPTWVGKLTFEADAGTADISVALNARYRGHGSAEVVS